jgi:hypothetical protein
MEDSLDDGQPIDKESSVSDDVNEPSVVHRVVPPVASSELHAMSIRVQVAAGCAYQTTEVRFDTSSSL